MKAILRNNHNNHLAKIIDVKFLMVSDNIPGIQIEADNYIELFNDLTNSGFTVELKGKILFVSVSSVSVSE